VSAESIRFTRTGAQWCWAVGALTVLVIGIQLAFASTGPTPPSTTGQQVTWTLTFLVSYGALTAAVFRWQGVTLSRAALTVDGLRPRVIPWPDIAGISLERRWGGTVVVVDETSGRRTRLRAPTTGLLGWDRGFEAKYRTIGEWYLALRGR
jgi:hypothetical protein